MLGCRFPRAQTDRNSSLSSLLGKQNEELGTVLPGVAVVVVAMLVFLLRVSFAFMGIPSVRMERASDPLLSMGIPTRECQHHPWNDEPFRWTKRSRIGGVDPCRRGSTVGHGTAVQLLVAEIPGAGRVH